MIKQTKREINQVVKAYSQTVDALELAVNRLEENLAQEQAKAHAIMDGSYSQSPKTKISFGNKSKYTGNQTLLLAPDGTITTERDGYDLHNFF